MGMIEEEPGRPAPGPLSGPMRRVLERLSRRDDLLIGAAQVTAAALVARGLARRTGVCGGHWKITPAGLDWLSGAAPAKRQKPADA